MGRAAVSVEGGGCILEVSFNRGFTVHIITYVHNFI